MIRKEIIERIEKKVGSTWEKEEDLLIPSSIAFTSKEGTIIISKEEGGELVLSPNDSSDVLIPNFNDNWEYLQSLLYKYFPSLAPEVWISNGNIFITDITPTALYFLSNYCHPKDGICITSRLEVIFRFNIPNGFLERDAKNLKWMGSSLDTIYRVGKTNGNLEGVYYLCTKNFNLYVGDSQTLLSVGANLYSSGKFLMVYPHYSIPYQCYNYFNSHPVVDISPERLIKDLEKCILESPIDLRPTVKLMGEVVREIVECGKVIGEDWGRECISKCCIFWEDSVNFRIPVVVINKTKIDSLKSYADEYIKNLLLEKLNP